MMEEGGEKEGRRDKSYDIWPLPLLPLYMCEGMAVYLSIRTSPTHHTYTSPLKWIPLPLMHESDPYLWHTPGPRLTGMHRHRHDRLLPLYRSLSGMIGNNRWHCCSGQLALCSCCRDRSGCNTILSSPLTMIMIGHGCALLRCGTAAHLASVLVIGRVIFRAAT